jgi:hypothetical protein
VAGIWSGAVKAAIQDMRSVEALPNDIYLFGGGAELSALSEKLSEPSWTSDLPVQGSFNVRVLDPSSFGSCKDATGNLGSSAWVLPLALGYIDF